MSEIIINKPYANNEPNIHDVNNSAPKTFAGSNEPSSLSFWTTFKIFI